jgi:DNA repair exonuclease SbcCD ATPase subunit
MRDHYERELAQLKAQAKRLEARMAQLERYVEARFAELERRAAAAEAGLEKLRRMTGMPAHLPSSLKLLQ